MRKLGYPLIGIAFLAGSLATVVDGGAVRWRWFVPALVVGAAGVALVQTALRRAGRHEERVAGNLQSLRGALDRIVDNLAGLNRERQGVDVYDLRHRIDERFLEDLDTFVNARESLAHAFGLQEYADLMSHFAAGERYLNRVWCCSADGYVDEAHAYLDRAAEQFGEAQTRLRALQG